MSRRKVEYAEEQNYPAILQKYCEEEDVTIIPEFVIFTRDQLHSSNYYKKLDQPRESINESFETHKADEVIVICETDRDKDLPVAVLCKNIYVEPSFISAFGKSLKFFPTLDSLKIEQCCIGQDLAKILAVRLTEEPGKQISDLSLDGNPDIAQTLHLFITLPNGLKSLSVERCGLDDEAAKVLGLSLEYSSSKGGKLQVLNLGLNKIGDRGVSYLARALRINRTLNSLSLLGNQIGDAGVTCLAEVLQEFPLTDEETFYRRKKIFQDILNKQSNLKKNNVEKGSEPDITKPGHSTSNWKARGRLSKIHGLNERRKNKPNSSKTIFSSKFADKQLNDKEEFTRKSDLKLANKDFSNFFSRPEVPDSTHAFVTEVFIANGKPFCHGCWSLFNLNMAYNYLTEKSVEIIVKVLQYQRDCNKFSNVGLSRVILLPGNYIQENSGAFRNFRSILSHQRKEGE